MRVLAASAVVFLMVASAVTAQSLCEDETPGDTLQAECPAIDPPLPQVDPLFERFAHYATVEAKHRLCGLASYYSASLDGTLTANGEIFRNRRFTAAHLTLPLGTWVEVRSRATGRTIRVRVNDRGPYVKKFCLDLSKAAAHALGVDVAEDRHVDIRIIALPGEEPLPVDAVGALAEETTER
ncbi:MAG TPA: septal ring lytic transglycosylase RlpA family protein [Thermoanaerobaculia bacterium]|nr:septal ring lytic transglycosylase RlpA family protein [Thermoanaerobaculia bacterium]